MENAEALAAQRPAMIAHLDEVRGFMEELSPELGVTDPVLEIFFLGIMIGSLPKLIALLMVMLLLGSSFVGLIIYFVK